MCKRKKWDVKDIWESSLVVTPYINTCHDMMVIVIGAINANFEMGLLSSLDQTARR